MIDDGRLGVVESRFADIIWKNEPIKSGELVKICDVELDWRKSTTYTVLKKLCDKGLFQNVKGLVTAVVTKERFYELQGETIVNAAFDGSLAGFVAEYAKNNPLSQEEIDAIVKQLTEK